MTFDCAQLDPSGNLMVGLNFQDVDHGRVGVRRPRVTATAAATKPIVYSFLRPGFYKVSLYARTAERHGVPLQPQHRRRSRFALASTRARASALEVTLYRQ